MHIWRDTKLIDYPGAIARMEARVQAIAAGTAPDTLWFLEHPPLFTAGTSAHQDDYVGGFDFPVYETGRGGQYTYHGPGQRIVYTMFDLTKRRRDVRCFVQDLEQVIIETLRTFGVLGERRAGRVGVWVDTPEGEKKIAALGIRLRKWVSFHGISINVHPNLDHFGGVVPCGLAQYGVTSLHDLGEHVSLGDVDAALETAFKAVFMPQNETPERAI